MSRRRARELAGPVGERNTYGLRPKGTILCVAGDPHELQGPAERRHGTGNQVTSDRADRHIAAVAVRRQPRASCGRSARRMAGARRADRAGSSSNPIRCEFLIDEVSLSVNTAAAGGNASLMAIG